MACRNNALYLKKGKETFIDAANLFRNTFTYNFPGTGELEVYANRDSISYIDIYGIPETKTMYRGTLRYKGWCESLDGMKSISMFGDKTGRFPEKNLRRFSCRLCRGWKK